MSVSIYFWLFPDAGQPQALFSTDSMVFFDTKANNNSGESIIRLDTGAPSGYLDPYLQVFSDKNPYLDLQGSFPTVHLDPQVFYLQVTGQQVLKVPAGIQ